MKRIDMSAILSLSVLMISIVVGCAEVQKPSLDAEAYNNRGIAYVKKGQYDRAISDLNKAIEINPNLVEAYFLRGLAYRHRGQYDRAISDFTKAIEINPKFANAYYHRGVAHFWKIEY